MKARNSLEILPNFYYSSWILFLKHLDALDPQAQVMIRCTCPLKSSGEMLLVRMSAGLILPSILYTLIKLPAMFWRTMWYAMLSCFFLRVLPGMVELSTADWLSQKILDRSLTLTPMERKVWMVEMVFSTAFLKAMNSAPWVAASTLSCFLVHH